MLSFFRSRSLFCSLSQGCVSGVGGTVPSWTVLECPVLECPVLECPVLDSPVLSWTVLDCPALDCPVLDYLVLDCPVLGCPGLSCPVLSWSVLSWTVLDCHVLGCPVLDCELGCREPAASWGVVNLYRRRAARKASKLTTNAKEKRSPAKCSTGHLGRNPKAAKGD
jgi:hypothetical protein